MLEHSKTVYYLHGALDRKYRSLMAPHLIHWQLIKQYKQAGYHWYDLWGINANAWPGVTRFKLGFGGQTFFDASPILSNPVVESGDTTATFAWSTNEPTQGQVYWSTSPLQLNEATGPKQQPFVSGTVALDTGGLQTSHMVTISNLQPDTTYYYLVRSVDSTGNMSMIWPRSFHTED